MKKLLFFLTITVSVYPFLPNNGWLGPRDPEVRLSNEPLISGDNFRAHADYRFDETNLDFDPESVQPGDIVFMNPMLLFFYVQHIHPKIAHPYILITHNSDIPVPDYYIDFLEDPKIIAWFSPNGMIPNHPKLHVLPLGVNNAYFQMSYTLTTVMQKKTDKKRINKAYLNFTKESNPLLRTMVWNHFCNKPFCAVSEKKPYEEYLMDMKTYTYVISPSGFGIDCYRNWEALLMGSIPVIKHSTIDAVFDGLPVIFIHDWSMVDEATLTRAALALQGKKFQYERLLFPYWWDKILAVQREWRCKYAQ